MGAKNNYDEVLKIRGGPQLICTSICHHLIYPLTMRVVGAPQMILQPVFSIFLVLYCPLGLGELQACLIPDVVFTNLLPFASSSFPLSLCLAKWFWPNLMNGGGMTIPLQFASLYDGQEVFVWSDCLQDLGTDFLVGNMVFV